MDNRGGDRGRNPLNPGSTWPRPPMDPQVVRGEDLLTSTARQLLLYRALSLPAPAFFHTPLVLDGNGVRLVSVPGRPGRKKEKHNTR